MYEEPVRDDIKITRGGQVSLDYVFQEEDDDGNITLPDLSGFIYSCNFTETDDFTSPDLLTPSVNFNTITNELSIIVDSDQTENIDRPKLWYSIWETDSLGNKRLILYGSVGVLLT